MAVTFADKELRRIAAALLLVALLANAGAGALEAESPPFPPPQPFAAVKAMRDGGNRNRVVLRPVPASDHADLDFAPSKTIKAAYSGLTAGGSGDSEAEDDVDGGTHVPPPVLVSAKCEFETTRPAINLANFHKHIARIQCAGGADGARQVLVTMRDAQTAERAAAAWRFGGGGSSRSSISGNGNIHGDGDLGIGMLLGHEFARACAGNDGAAISVSLISWHVQHVERIQGTNTLALSAQPLPPAELIKRYDIQVAQHATQQRPERREREDDDGDYDDNGAADTEGIWDNFKRRLNNTQLALNINYDVAASRAKREVQIAHIPGMLKVDCTDCYVFGEALLRAGVKGTPQDVEEYDLEVTGALKGNVDVETRFFQPKKDRPLRMNIASVPLTPIEIPGIFTLGPELALDAAIKFGIDFPSQGVGVTFGADLLMQIGWRMKSPSIWKRQPPKFSSVPGVDNKPELTVHPPKFAKDTPANMRAWIAPYLIPELRIALKVLSMASLYVGVELGNSLGIEARGADPQACQQAGRPAALRLFREHYVGASVRSRLYSKSFTLYSSGRLPIDCPFCQVCLPIDRPINDVLKG